MQRIRPQAAYAQRPCRIRKWPPELAAVSAPRLLLPTTDDRWRRPTTTTTSPLTTRASTTVPPRPRPLTIAPGLRAPWSTASAALTMRDRSCTASRSIVSRNLRSTTTTTTTTTPEESSNNVIHEDGPQPPLERRGQRSSSSFEDRMLKLDDCLAQVHRALVDVTDSLSAPMGTSKCNGTGSHVASILEGAIRQAHEAHNLLEEMVPELSHRQQQQLPRQIPASYDNSSPALSTTGTDHRLALPRCCQLLDAWSKLCRAGHDLMKVHRHHDHHHHHQQQQQQQHFHATQLRGVPQRAQFVLDQMERTPGLSPPPPLAYHSVMECWSFSSEHRRATMAEAGFQRLYGPKSQFPPPRGSRWPPSSTAAERVGLLSPQSQQPQQQPQGRRRRPTIDAHRIMVHAWARSTRDPRAAFHATGHLMRMVKLVQRERNDDADDADDDDGDSSGGRGASEPTLDDFRVVLEAWTRAEDKTSPSKAYSALRLMENACARDGTTARPDLDCYRAVLRTAARRAALPDLDVLVDSVLTAMRHQLIPPDTACYEAAAKVYKNMALLNSGLIGSDGPSTRAPATRRGGTISAATSRSSVGVIHDARVRDKCVSRALELLDEIQVAQHQQGESHAQLSTRTVNHILEALSVSRLPQRSEIATQLLSNLEEGLVVGNESRAPAVDRSPNLETYRLVLDVWKSVGATSASDDAARLAGAEAVLDRLQLRCFDIVRTQQEGCGASGRQIRNDLVATYNAFIEVCGTAKPASEEAGTATFRLALTRLQGLRTLSIGVTSGDQQRPLSLSPNAESYACLLEACVKLLPNGKDRQRWVDRVFRLACDEGMVDDGVLQRLRLAVTDEQYSRLVISESEASEGSKLVPEAWTRNALRGRVVTSEGRRTTPLTVQGRFTVTPAMQEFRMRRLRDHRNRNLLQGGRLQLGSSTGEN